MESAEMGTSPKTQYIFSRSVNLRSQTAETKESFLSPGFRSTVAMAGWDEESLLAGLVVQDTPERDSVNHKKRTIFPTKTPPTDSRRKRRAQRKSSTSVSSSSSSSSSASASLPVVALSLEDDEPVKEGDRETEEKKNGEGDCFCVVEEVVKPPQCKAGKDEGESGNNAFPCINQLKEELSCAICLEICFEPSTTPCGHSFCKNCLKSAANKCGKRCPKCRQTIGNGRSCTVNTVLWNTIRLLFPKEVEARKAAMPVGRSQSEDMLTPEKSSSTTGRRSPRYNNFIMSSELVNLDEIHRSMRIERSRNVVTGRTQISRAAAERSRITRGNTVRPSQSEDAAMALRMQREEFLGSITETSREVVVVENRRSSVNSARENLRAIASRAIQIRTRSRA